MTQATQDAVCESCRAEAVKAAKSTLNEPSLEMGGELRAAQERAVKYAAEAISALPLRAQDEGKPVSETYRLDDLSKVRSALAFFRSVIRSDEPWSHVCEDTYKDAVEWLAGYSRRTQPAQDEGERDLSESEVDTIWRAVMNAHATYRDSALKRPAITELVKTFAQLFGYSRRTVTAEFLAKYDAGMMAAAEETIAFLKQRAEKAEAELARRAEATGEAREIARKIVQFLCISGADETVIAIDHVAAAIARAAEERAIELADAARDIMKCQFVPIEGPAVRAEIPVVKVLRLRHALEALRQSAAQSDDNA